MNLIFNALTSIFEIIIILFCFSSILNKRDLGKCSRYSIIILCTVFNIVRSMFNIEGTINLVITIVLMGIISVVLYKDKWFKKIFAIMIFIFILMVAEILSQYIVSTVMSASYGAVATENRYFTLPITDFIAFMILLYFVNIPIKKIVDIPIRYWLMIIIMPLFSLAVLLILDVIVSANIPFYTIWSMVIIVGLVYCNIMLYSFFETYSSRIKLEVAEQIIQNNQENYKILESNERDMRILRHDILKHMSTIKELVSNSGNENIMQYAEQLEQTVRNATSAVYTGNATMDSILNIEGRKASVYDIQYFVKASVLSDIRISDIDITAILRNALDNAIEAQKSLEKRCIVTNISVDDEKIKIEIENFSGDVKLSDGYTSKKNKTEHGYGLKSIKSAIEKYNGEITTAYNNSIFTLSLTLGNKKI